MFSFCVVPLYLPSSLDLFDHWKGFNLETSVWQAWDRALSMLCRIEVRVYPSSQKSSENEPIPSYIASYFEMDDSLKVVENTVDCLSL